MSIDLYIAPTNPNYFSWGELKDKFIKLLVSENIHEIEKISLLRLGSDEIIKENEKLSIDVNNKYDCYYFSLNIPNTLGIKISESKRNYIDEVDYLEDFGRNLDSNIIRILARKWQLVGHYYSLTTLAGRSKYEPPLFVALAAAIAYLCDGYVIVMSNNFSLDVGVYPPEEFQQAKMKF